MSDKRFRSFCDKSPSIKRDSIIKACREAGDPIVGEMCNPGGREIIFKSGKSMQVSDQCTHCDGEKIIEFVSVAK